MKRLTLVILCTAIATFMGRLDTNIVGIALPAIADFFHVGAGGASNLMLYYLLAISLLLIPLGALGDRIGFGKLLLAGYGVFTLGSLACGMAGSLFLLTASRAVQGGGAAMMLIAAYSLIPRMLPIEKIGKAMGSLSTAGSVGVLIGAPLGGVLTEWLSWRSIFLINLPVGLAAMWLVWRHLLSDEEQKSPQPPLDWVGCLSASATVLCVILGVDLLRSSADYLVPGGLLAAGCVFAILFVIRQRRAAHPLFDPALFASPLYRRALTVQGMMFLAIAAHGFALPFYLDRVMALSHQAAGLTLALFPVGVSVAAPMAGRKADSGNPARVILVGVAGNACVTGLFALALHLGLKWAIYPYLPLMGVCFGTFLAPSAKLLLAGLSKGSQGGATSIFHTVNNVALTLGVALSALLLATSTGGVHTASHAASAYFPLYTVLTICCLVAAWLAAINRSGSTAD